MKKYAAVIAALGASLIVSGCAITPADSAASDNADRPSDLGPAGNCVFKAGVVSDVARCSLEFWFDYWSKVSKLPWVTRQSLIAELGNTPDALLQKVMLSQPTNTPYRSRLRAQNWLEQVMPSLTRVNQARFTAAIAEPSNHILEYESALSLMNRSNQALNDALAAQTQETDEVRAQLDALLNIESNLMGQKEETEQ
ncbi:hypothetical protein [Alteromonas gilva]|uniref:Uncharacterized protein n=1 Tax=Alteromonas gilva TaxID=2987522 RepID=A0ABT5L562_9ALTE|nr:hypothetical protein [Alteromonas gilva]MDC8831534.1 hypothetical protein [Alteromonas gilva]